MSRNDGRSARIEVRTTPDVLDVLKRAAEIEGRSLSNFVVAAARETAYRMIEPAHFIRLVVDEQAVLHPVATQFFNFP